ncbi:MAG: DNA/RNA non-specific endonuclease [bacterium]|jgi:endonuclease G, mitochondrial
MIRLLLILVWLFAGIMSYTQDSTYLPVSTTGDVYYHTYFCFSYAEEHEQAEWVCYMLTDTMVYGTTPRSDRFREDPEVVSGSAKLTDYAGSGYDRGHLAPAADMCINPTAMSECFYLSNMSPQEGSFNSGRWRMLETAVRNWAIDFDTVYVVTGPVFKRSRKSIGEEEVTVPKRFYKIVYDAEEREMIAFIMRNKKLRDPLDDFIVTVDEVEKMTGIDFFASLPDSLENEMESTVNEAYWVINTKEPAKTTIEGERRQCKAITAAGTRCTRTAQPGSDFCWQHQK